MRELKKLMTGHFNIGTKVTVYGNNAMHYAVNIRTKYGILCMRPSTRSNGGQWRWYIYLSPDGTPDSASWGIGPGIDRYDKERIAIRRAVNRESKE